MDKHKPQKTDEEIIGEFNSLFEEIPEPKTNKEIEEFLIDVGYDPEELKTKGLELVENLIADNWRFITSDEIHQAATKINETSLRKDWNRSQLLQAIKKLSNVLTQGGGEPVLAFRNLEKLTDIDLASLLQELEYEANAKGINLELN